MSHGFNFFTFILLELD
ncbi:CRISPR-associated DxTHG motif protein [Aquimarina sp. 2201CG1-2-11]